MRWIFMAMLAGVACALPNPIPQGFDYEMLDAAPDPTIDVVPVGATDSTAANTNTAALVSSVMLSMATDPATTFEKRTVAARTATMSNGCQVQPTGYGSIPSPDTAYAFVNHEDFANAALSAPVPQGYTLSFSDLKGSTQSTDLLTYTTLKSYDPVGCQQYCDSLLGCYGMNLYYERDPKIDPCNVANADGPSTTVIKCVTWGSQASLDPSLATNTGQWRGPSSNITGHPFHVVIAGSNGYIKNTAPGPLAGYTGPISLGGAMNAPLLTNGTNSYLGAKIFPGASYDSAICAAACNAQTRYGLAHPRSDSSSNSCAFFNVYMLSVNNVPNGLYCSLYTTTWGRSYGMNYGQVRAGIDGVSRRYEVSQSYVYTVNGYAGFGPGNA